MEWNKINVDSYKTSIESDEPLFLEINSNTKLDLIVKEDIHSTITIIGCFDYDINIKLEKDSGLIISSLNKDNNVSVNITMMDNSNITYYHSVLADSNSVNTFNINHIGDATFSDVFNNGINRNDGKLFFTVNGVVPKKLHNIICNQDSKIINFKKGNSKIIPNLLIESNDIMASHSSYIGEIDEVKLFYMKSRGISHEEIEKLVYRSVLLGRLSLESDIVKEEFNKIINEWW